ncbi:MAG: efflux RND transporter permease subunit, partial [Gemmataceae bacterium]|nr:efflux RND transporter permease subunit [Gemmataceae bacterium]
EAAFLGASEVALPSLAATFCTLLVLAPLAFVPGLGPFLFTPLALAVAFAILSAYLISMTLVPVLCSMWLSGHAHDDQGHAPAPSRNPFAWLWRGLTAAYHWWDGLLNKAIAAYTSLLDGLLKMRLLVIGVAGVLLVLVVFGVGSRLRREFFPEVDAGAFEVAVRARSGTRLEETVERVASVEEFIRDVVGDDLDLIISETGVTPDWSAAYTPNAGPMDAVIKVQLNAHHHHTAQRHVRDLRREFKKEASFTGLEFAFDTGGMIRGAMNEGKSTPLNLQITGKDLKLCRQVAERLQADLQGVRGVEDCRILQRLDYPQYVINVDKTKAANLGLTQSEVMRNVVAAFNSSIQYNKKNFWIDPVSSNQYYVGVQYPEADIKSLETMLQIPITGANQKTPVPLSNLVQLPLPLRRVPAELVHTNLQSTIDVTMNIEGRDLGHVADDVWKVLSRHGQPLPEGGWAPFDPRKDDGTVLKGTKMALSGEYTRMNDMFRNLGLGLVVAALLVYFLMVGMFRSWLVPTVILSAVPVGLVGVVLVLFLTKTAINVQSLLGVIFMVGIVVSNTVLLIDFAQTLRKSSDLTPTQAILEAAKVRVKPVMMTALAAFFALLPMSLGLAHGSEANTPLGRAVLGGLVAGVMTTLLVVPCLYSLLLPGAPGVPPTPDEKEPLVG